MTDWGNHIPTEPVKKFGARIVMKQRGSFAMSLLKTVVIGILVIFAAAFILMMSSGPMWAAFGPMIVFVGMVIIAVLVVGVAVRMVWWVITLPFRIFRG